MSNEMEKSIPDQTIARLFRNLSQPERVRILFAIGEGESCVCHLEAMLELRQAYISQHLMALREAGILTTRRDGRFVYYRLANPELLVFLRQAGELTGLTAQELDNGMPALQTGSCCCPKCVGEAAQASPLFGCQPQISALTEAH